MDRFERTTLEHAVRILMTEQQTPNKDGLYYIRCHEAVEAIREILYMELI